MYYWLDLYLRHDGVLVDVEGDAANSLWPVFRTPEAADEWLCEEDVRATCVGRVTD